MPMCEIRYGGNYCFVFVSLQLGQRGSSFKNDQVDVINYFQTHDTFSWTFTSKDKNMMKTWWKMLNFRINILLNFEGFFSPPKQSNLLIYTFSFCICGSTSLVSDVIPEKEGLGPALTAEMHFSVHWALTCIRTARGGHVSSDVLLFSFRYVVLRTVTKRPFFPLINCLGFTLNHTYFLNITLDF